MEILVAIPKFAGEGWEKREEREEGGRVGGRNWESWREERESWREELGELAGDWRRSRENGGE